MPPLLEGRREPGEGQGPRRRHRQKPLASLDKERALRDRRLHRWKPRAHRRLRLDGLGQKKLHGQLLRDKVPSMAWLFQEDEEEETPDTDGPLCTTMEVCAAQEALEQSLPKQQRGSDTLEEYHFESRQRPLLRALAPVCSSRSSALVFSDMAVGVRGHPVSHNADQPFSSRLFVYKQVQEAAEAAGQRFTTVNRGSSRRRQLYTFTKSGRSRRTALCDYRKRQKPPEYLEVQGAYNWLCNLTYSLPRDPYR